MTSSLSKITQPQQAFCHFQSLAIEIRLMVWEYACDTDNRPVIVNKRPRLPVPGVLHASREARTEALKAFQQFELNQIPFGLRMHLPDDAFIYVNPATDIMTYDDILIATPIASYFSLEEGGCSDVTFPIMDFMKAVVKGKVQHIAISEHVVVCELSGIRKLLNVSDVKSFTVVDGQCNRIQDTESHKDLKLIFRDYRGACRWAPLIDLFPCPFAQAKEDDGWVFNGLLRSATLNIDI